MDKIKLVYTKDGRHFMTLDMFLALLVTLNVLNKPEAKIARETGKLPDNILERLKIAEGANNN